MPINKAEQQSLISKQEAFAVLEKIPLEHLLVYLAEKKLVPQILFTLDRGTSIGSCSLSLTGIELGSTTIPLTPKQRSIIHELLTGYEVNSSGVAQFQPITCEALIRKANDNVFIAADMDALRVNMAHLRKKMLSVYRELSQEKSDDSLLYPWIVTVRGVGYKLVILPLQKILETADQAA